MNKTAAYTNTITLCSSPASSAMRNYMNTDISSRSAIIMEVKKCQKYAKITAKILIIYVMIITWIPTPVRNVPAWYALLPKMMTNGIITGRFLILFLILRIIAQRFINDHITAWPKSGRKAACKHPFDYSRQENVQTNDLSEVLSVLWKNCLLHVSVPVLASLLPDAALELYWNNLHLPEIHPVFRI